MTRRIRAPALAAVAVIALLALAAPVPAAIVPGTGIAGVSLRMTASQVRGRLGAPERIRLWRGALGMLVTQFRYRWGDVDFEALHAHEAPVVVRVSTTRQGERTASGVGVGSPVSLVKQLRAIRCWWEGADRYCGIGNRDRPLSRFTLFWIGADRHVKLVSVSLIVNS